MRKPKSYEGRVRAYEKQGMSTSDAQAVADADDMRAMSGPNAVELHRLRTVNAELLAAIEEARSFIGDRSDDWDEEEDHLIASLDAAIAKAKEPA